LDFQLEFRCYLSVQTEIRILSLKAPCWINISPSPSLQTSFMDDPYDCWRPIHQTLAYMNEMKMYDNSENYEIKIESQVKKHVN